MTHKEFEYKILNIYTDFFSSSIDAEGTEKTLNDLGAQGWELVSFMDTQNRSGRSKGITAVLKREKQF